MSTYRKPKMDPSRLIPASQVPQDDGLGPYGVQYWSAWWYAAGRMDEEGMYRRANGDAPDIVEGLNCDSFAALRVEMKRQFDVGEHISLPSIESAYNTWRDSFDG